MAQTDISLIKNAKGIGDSTLEDFKQAGYSSAEEVGSESPEELAEKVNGVGYSTAISVLKYLEREGLRDTEARDEELERLVELLRDLFEFDAEDRDFGVYKLMNANREQIDKFIQDDLTKKVERVVAELQNKFENEQTQLANNSTGQNPSAFSDDKWENIRADIYNHIYQFLSTYYDRGDFITRRKRSHHEEPYSVPYDGSNTLFYWVTKDQYYSKTSENFMRFSFSYRKNQFQFNTEYGELDGSGVGNSEYFIMEDTDDIEETGGGIQVTFYRRMIGEDDLERFDISANTHNKQDKMNQVFAEQLSENYSIDTETANKKLDEYTTRNQNDFFIHKDIEGFLNNELEEYIKSEIVSFDPETGIDGMTDISVEKARVVNEVTTDIISFVSQIEEFKRKLFEKKKFVKNKKELIQVKNIPKENYDLLLSSDEQLGSWEESYGVDTSELDKEALKQAPANQMMVDTRFFEEDITIGEEPRNKLIKGDNYQALNFLQEKYEESVKCIYIDPPYNTGNANFAYKDNYQRPTWLSMMYDRLKLAKELLQKEGVIFVNIDYREVENLTKILNEIFGKENKVTSFVWKKRSGSNNLVDMVSTDHEYVLCYKKSSENAVFKGEEKDFNAYSNPDDDQRGVWRSDDMKSPSTTKDERPEAYYPIENPETGETYYPDGETTWRYSKEKMKKLIEEDRISWPENSDGTPRLKRFKSEVDSHKPISSLIPDESDVDKEKRDIVYTNMNSTATFNQKSIFGTKVYDFPKPVSLVKTLINQVTEDDEIVLDFFAGSGTTAQAVQELNRERDEQMNYILVEMLDEAFNITEERVKRTAYVKDWKDGKPQVDNSEEVDTGLDLDVECLELESYEEALDAIEFNSKQKSLGEFNDMLLNYLLEYGTKDSPVLLDTDQLDRPLEYELQQNLRPYSVDIMTTFNYLIGLEDVTRSEKTINQVDYTIFDGQTSGGSLKVVWRHNAEDADFDAEKEEIEFNSYDKVYINGDSTIDGTNPISKHLKRTMMNDTDEL